MACLACERIEQIRLVKNPWFVRELEESYLVLSDEQRYTGWSILLLKDHHEHLVRLPVERQLRLFGDVAKAAAAVQKAFSPQRLNYECLGNTLAHIHWHVIPRYSWDPQPKSPVWVRPAEERQVTVPDEERDGLVARIRKALGA